jgi:hypothetical protein
MDSERDLEQETKDAEEDERRWNVYRGFHPPNDNRDWREIFDYINRVRKLLHPDFTELDFMPWQSAEHVNDRGDSWEHSEDTDSDNRWEQRSDDSFSDGYTPPQSSVIVKFNKPV